MKLEYSYNVRPGQKVTAYASCPKYSNEALDWLLTLIDQVRDFPGFEMKLEV